MENCLENLLGKPQSYFDTWHKHLLSQDLYVEVISGALKGTFGRYVGIYFAGNTHGRVTQSWNNFHENPSEKNWQAFRNNVARKDDRPKLSIIVNEATMEYTQVSIYNCNWSFIAKPLGKVSSARAKKEIKEEDLPEVYDHLGEQIHLGDFCSYILYHHRCSGAQIYYGVVTKITLKGDVYCTDINVGDWPECDTVSKEKKVLDPSMITILNESIMDRIMMARLGS